MSIQGVNSLPTPEEPKQGLVQASVDNQDDKKFSIFDANKDGTVTVAEQQDAIRQAATKDHTIQRAIREGFDLDWYIDRSGELCEEIKTNTAKTIGKLIVTPQEMVAHANKTVQSLIDTIREKAEKYLQHKLQKNVGEGWGI